MWSDLTPTDEYYLDGEPMKRTGTTERTLRSRFVHVARHVCLGVFVVASLVVGPLATLTLGASVLATAALGPALLTAVGVVAFAVVYWGVVWWVEQNGLFQWNVDERTRVEAGLTDD